MTGEVWMEVERLRPAKPPVPVVSELKKPNLNR